MHQRFLALAQELPIEIQRTSVESMSSPTHHLNRFGGPNVVNVLIAEGLIEKVLMKRDGRYSGFSLILTDKGREYRETRR